MHYIVVQTDVTQLHNAQLALAHQASFAVLTGLPNRSLFNDRIVQVMSLARRQKKILRCCLWIWTGSRRSMTRWVTM